MTAAGIEKRRRGRPARLSREVILEAGLALLAREPQEPLTLARIAAEVGAVPAALYRHFASHDHLLDGVLGLLLQGVQLEIRQRARWTEQVRDWMTCVRTHLLRFPAVLPLLGRRDRTSPAWLEVTATLLTILERGGLRGSRLAFAYLWIAETTTGLVIQEAALSLPEQLAAARAALREMDREGGQRLASLLPPLESLDADTLFAFAVDRTLVALVEFAGAPRSGSGSVRAQRGKPAEVDGGQPSRLARPRR